MQKIHKFITWIGSFTIESRSTMLVMLFLLSTCACVSSAEKCESPKQRFSLWVNALNGEPLGYGQVLEDLADARVIYLGERHTIERHHALQARIVRDLAGKGLPLLLGLEQMQAHHQATLDKYCRREIDFDQLAEKTQWEQQWPGYEQYRRILEDARRARVPILALNAKKETIRQVARSGGLKGLDAQTRKELPEDIWLDDPAYEGLLNMIMQVHMAATPARLRPMVEAQMCRDATMAATLCRALSAKGRQDHKAIVLCGSGHVSYGFGIPDRVRRRLPGVKDRIILLSASGDVILTEGQKAVSRDITITQDQLRKIGRPPADYLHVTSLKTATEEPCPDDAPAKGP